MMIRTILAAVMVLVAGSWSMGTGGPAMALEPVPWPADDGYRMTRFKAPVPDSVPGGITVETAEAKRLIDEGLVVPIDVVSSSGRLTSGVDGNWLPVKERRNLIGSLWWPDVGKGALTDEQLAFFESRLSSLPEGKAPLFYCMRDCWMSWNAVKRAASFGVEPIYWFPEGSNGWEEAGYPLQAGMPDGRAWTEGAGKPKAAK